MIVNLAIFHLSVKMFIYVLLGDKKHLFSVINLEGVHLHKYINIVFAKSWTFSYLFHPEETKKTVHLCKSILYELHTCTKITDLQLFCSVDALQNVGRSCLPPEMKSLPPKHRGSL